jgi:hypothetical protein
MATDSVDDDVFNAAQRPSAGVWAEPALHPIFNLGMEPRYVSYCAENAVNAQLLARTLIAICVRNPKPKHPELVKWCEPLVDAVPKPHRRRPGPTPNAAEPVVSVRASP